MNSAPGAHFVTDGTRVPSTLNPGGLWIKSALGVHVVMDGPCVHSALIA